MFFCFYNKLLYLCVSEIIFFQINTCFIYRKLCFVMDNNRITLDSFINQRESHEIEFKSAKGGFPGSFWETYSAFANTNGGVIVLGVVEKNHQFFFDGLDEEKIIKYKKVFWDCVHNREKISVCVTKESDVRIEQIGDSYLLVFDIPRASYELRPVYVGPKPFGNTYRRNDEGDYVCTDDEVRRMFADADHDRRSQDSRILTTFNIDRDVDKESFSQYRQTFASLQPTHPWVGINDREFMKKIGAYAIDYESGEEGLTAAGLLMFGVYDSITNTAFKPNFFVDYRERIGAENSGMRWTHRIYPDGLWEANLYQFYIRVYNRLIQALPRPFIIKGGVRQEESPAHDAVREALVNCIIHQDLSALGNIIVERTDNELCFRNPGIMLVSQKQYFEGGRSICRNPILQKMFMRLGRAEKAGSGVDKIVSGWEYLGLPKPQVKEEVRPDYVVLTLSLVNGTVTHQKGAVTPQEGAVTPQEVSVTPQEVSATPQEIAAAPQDGKGYIKERMDIRVRKILEFCENPRTLIEILHYLGLKDRKNLVRLYILPLISEGRLGMTDVKKPRNKNQRYYTVKED